MLITLSKLHELAFYDVLSILLSKVLNAVLVCLYSPAISTGDELLKFNSAGDRPLRGVACQRSSQITAHILPLKHKIVDTTRDHSYGILNHKAWDRDQQCLFFHGIRDQAVL